MRFPCVAIFTARVFDIFRHAQANKPCVTNEPVPCNSVQSRHFSVHDHMIFVFNLYKFSSIFSSNLKNSSVPVKEMPFGADFNVISKNAFTSGLLVEAHAQYRVMNKISA